MVSLHDETDTWDFSRSLYEFITTTVLSMK